MKKNPNKTNLETLTLQEIQQLKGGEEPKVDVLNDNNSSTCECTYNNHSLVIKNDNSVSGCYCRCL